MFFSSIRQAIRDRKRAEADRDYWKARAEKFEARLEERDDFMREREFRLVDRFLTAKVKTHAITDEIRGRKFLAVDDKRHAEQLEAYLEEKKQELIQMAKEAGIPDPAGVGARDFDRMKDHFIMDFQQNLSVM